MTTTRHAIAQYLAPAVWAAYLMDPDNDSTLSDWGLAWAHTFLARIPAGYVCTGVTPTDLMADPTHDPYCGGRLAIYTFVPGD